MVDVGGRSVAGAVDGLGSDGVAPVVAYDAGAMRIGACEHGGVAGSGDGKSMAVVRIGEPCAAVQEAREAIGRKLVAVVQYLPLRQAVNDKKDDQLGAGCSACNGTGRGGAAGEQRGGQSAGEQS